MTEAQWVEVIAKALRKGFPVEAPLRIVTGLRLAYGYEIGSYPEAANAQPTARASKGGLYRHGAQFDFMISFDEHRMAADERRTFSDLLKSEMEASRCLEKLLYESRSQKRDRYTVFHRRLTVK